VAATIDTTIDTMRDERRHAMRVRDIERHEALSTVR